MSDQYIGEIRMFGGTFAPMGWALCDGQTLNISANDVLFGVIGNRYGGDGVTTFALPDLRGRLPVHKGSGLTTGQKGGAEKVALTIDEIPHTHSLTAAADGASVSSPANASLAVTTASIYNAATAPVVGMAASGMGATGASPAQGHDNVQPFLCINFIIALEGNFPYRE